MPDTTAARMTADRIAVIDVGSNSVRLVIFGDSERSPLTLLNERAFCSLGEGMSRTGRLNPEGVENAITTLKRFRWMTEATNVADTIAFATAAVRDAQDGSAFVRRVRRECGIRLKVLDGSAESRLAALGVLFGMPDAVGIVGDLGGSSLELAPIHGGKVGEGVTLPVGPLHFIGQVNDPNGIRDTVAREVAKVDWLDRHRGSDFHVVGGTWRALAKLDIGARDYPLHIIQGYEMTLDRALALIHLIARQSPESLAGAEGIAARRLQVLPAAAMALESVVRHLRPRRLVFSAHGVREGAYFERLKDNVRRRDPLIACAESMAEQETRFGGGVGREIFDWIGGLFLGEDARHARLRLVACLIADVGWRTHPDYRATHSFRRVLRAPLLGVDHRDRAFVAMAVLRRYSHKALGDAVEEARSLIEAEDIALAERIGAAIRLAHTLGGGAPGALNGISISRRDARVTLSVPEEMRPLVGEVAESRLKRLAQYFGETPEVTLV